MKQIDLREGARRQHRAVSLFAVIQCWIRGLDGVAFQRTALERLLGLERFKRTRVKWIEEDLKEFFPHQATFWLSSQLKSFSSLIVSRSPLDGVLPKGSMSAKARLKGIPADGPKIELFQIWEVPKQKALEAHFEGIVPFFADAVNFDERFLSAYLNLLAEGQISPHNLPPLKAETANK